MARARTAREDYRPRGDRWRDDDDAAQAWAEGMTGIPIVDLDQASTRFQHERQLSLGL